MLFCFVALYIITNVNAPLFLCSADVPGIGNEDNNNIINNNNINNNNNNNNINNNNDNNNNIFRKS